MKKGRMKRFISFCMTAVLLLGMCTHLVGCGKETTTVDTQSEFQKDPNLTYLTRGEWIQGLAQTAGYTDTVTEEPYFTDIPADHELFTYVQAAADWELFEVLGGEFEPEADATREFIIATAVIAADVLEDAEYVEDDGDDENRESVAYDVCLQYYLDQGYIESMDEDFLAEAVDTTEAQTILDWVQSQLLNMAKEEICNVVWQEDVVDLSEYTSEVTESEVVIASNAELSLQPGDVFVTSPTQESLVGEARKVVSVSTNAAGDYVIVTETPALEEVFQELQITQTAVPDYENIIFYEDNIETLLQNQISTEPIATPVVSIENVKDGNPFSTDVKAKVKPITFSPLRIGASSKDGLYVSKVFSDENTKLEEKMSQESLEKFWSVFGDAGIVMEGMPGENPSLKKVDKFEGKFFIENTLQINELVAALELDVSPLGMSLGPIVGIKELGLGISFDMKDTIKVGGELKTGDVLKLATIPFTFGGVATINVDLLAYADGNGYLEFVFEFGGDYSFNYERLKMPTFVAKPDNKPVDSKVAVDVETGVNMSVDLKLLAIDVVKVGFKTGVLFSYEPMLREDVEVVETEEELIGKNGSAKKINPKELWSTEETLLYENVVRTAKDGIDAPEDFKTVLQKFVNAPANAQCSYENFYEKAGVQDFVSHLLFLDNPDDLTQTQQYIAGTNFSYTEEDMVFGDGSTLTGGAQLTFETQEADRWDRDYSIIWYEEGGLQRIRTDRVHTDTRNPGIVGNVGGFSDFLRAYQCTDINSCIEAFGLGEAFAEAAQQEQPDYYEVINTKKYGAVEVYLSYYADFTSEVKELVFVFQEDSGCPYKEIYIDERLANTLTAEIPILRVEAYTPLY